MMMLRHFIRYWFLVRPLYRAYPNPRPFVVTLRYGQTYNWAMFTRVRRSNNDATIEYIINNFMIIICLVTFPWRRFNGKWLFLERKDAIGIPLKHNVIQLYNIIGMLNRHRCRPPEIWTPSVSLSIGRLLLTYSYGIVSTALYRRPRDNNIENESHNRVGICTYIVYSRPRN